MAKERRNTARIQRLPFGKKNLYLLSIGLVLIIIGYIFMAQPPVSSIWSLSIAPIVLLIAYLVIIPLAIMHGKNKDSV